jgi:ACT domain-containing protein
MKRLWKTEAAMKKTIITVVGKDTVGIIARVCTYLAENQINILDISQTIVQGYFNMMMIVDTNRTEKDFGVVAEELERLGESIGVIIKCQKEEIFNQMHRI